MKMLPTLNLIGGGRVGKTLGRLWHTQQVLQIQDVLTTSLASAQEAVQFIDAGRPVRALRDMRAADYCLLAVPDSRIAATAHALAESGFPAACAFHASGALGSDTLAPLKQLGWSTASAHCILSFATPAAAVQQFPGTACGIEGDEVARAQLTQLFTAIGAQCFFLAADKKMLYHAAAVFATNFLPVLQSLAETLWQQSGVPPALLPQLRQSLLRHAVDNVLALGPAAALTGPAARGDNALVQSQGQALSAWNPEAGQAYAALSALAARLARGETPQGDK